MAAILGASGAGASESPSPPPIQLVSEVEGDTVLIRVIGASASAMSAEYRLEVTSGAKPGGNYTDQRGTARLVPNTRVVLLSTRLGGAAMRNWRVRLRVSPADGTPYEIERKGGES